MSTLLVDTDTLRAKGVTFSSEFLTLEIADGRRLSVPIAWFPRLLYGTPEERQNWRLIGAGAGIHWPALDEDISVSALFAGRGSGESKQSLEQWLNGRC